MATDSLERQNFNEILGGQKHTILSDLILYKLSASANVAS